jgi:hypothetical protein
LLFAAVSHLKSLCKNNSLLQSAKEIAHCVRINAVARAFLISTEGGDPCGDVMASKITDDPEYWQKRAEEARILAEQMMDTHTKSLMLGIAASYEKIAKWTEERRDEPR